MMINPIYLQLLNKPILQVNPAIKKAYSKSVEYLKGRNGKASVMLS